MQNLQYLINEYGISPLRPPVPEATLQEFELEARFRLPPELRALYLMCDGVEFQNTRFCVMPFAEARTHWDNWQRYGMGLHDFFPFTENNDSDPFCIGCDEILYGYIIHMTHERESHVKFRSLDAFFDAVTVWLRSRHWDMRYIKPEIKGAKRTSHDIKAAHKLIEKLPLLDDSWERVTLARFAMKLLSNQHVSEIAPFLEDEDVCVSRDAYERLKEIKNQDAVKELQRFDISIRQFMEECLDHLKQVGLEPEKVNFERLTIQIQYGFMGWSLSTFYAERHRPDFWEYFVETVRDLHEKEREKQEFPIRCESYLKQFKLPKMDRDGTVFYFWPMSLEGKSVKIDLKLLFDERHRPDFWDDYLIEYVYHKINQAEGLE